MCCLSSFLGRFGQGGVGSRKETWGGRQEKCKECNSTQVPVGKELESPRTARHTLPPPGEGWLGRPRTRGTLPGVGMRGSEGRGGGDPTGWLFTPAGPPCPGTARWFGRGWCWLPSCWMSCPSVLCQRTRPHTLPTSHCRASIEHDCTPI